MSCPVCLNPETVPALTGTDFLFETTAQTFHLSCCAACACLFIDPPPSPGDIAGFYPERYWWNTSSGILNRCESLYRRAALQGHIAFISNAAGSLRNTSRPVRLLDVGCGNGALLGLLKRRGFDVLGVDFSARAAAVARAENDVEVVVGSLHDAQFQEGSFDLVTLFHVMEHVVEPRRVLAEVHRILRPGGSVVLQVPNIDSWQFRLFRERWYGLDIPRHVIDYSKRSVERLLEDSRFSVRRVRHFNLRDNAPALASSLFPVLDPISRSVRQNQRGLRESVPAAWTRHLLYLAAVFAAFPFAVAEAAAGAGATLTIEASRG